MAESESSPPSVNDQLTEQIFEKFKSYLDQKVGNLTHSFTAQADHRSKQFERQSEGQQLKFPGNKDQYLFNADLEDALVQSTDLLKNDDVAGALSTLETTQKSLRQRQKKIKLADKSEAGWLAVKEYEADELASDSEDEKCIRKAQATALRKKNQSRQQRSSSQPNKATQSYCLNASSDNQLFRGTVFQYFRFYNICCPFPLLCNIRMVGKCIHAAYHLHSRVFVYMRM